MTQALPYNTGIHTYIIYVHAKAYTENWLFLFYIYNIDYIKNFAALHFLVDVEYEEFTKSYQPN